MSSSWPASLTSIQLILLHHLPLTFCWAFFLPQHVGNDICHHVLNLFQTSNPDTRECSFSKNPHFVIFPFAKSRHLELWCVKMIPLPSLFSASSPSLHLSKLSPKRETAVPRPFLLNVRTWTREIEEGAPRLVCTTQRGEIRWVVLGTSWRRHHAR